MPVSSIERISFVRKVRYINNLIASFIMMFIRSLSILIILYCLNPVIGIAQTYTTAKTASGKVKKLYDKAQADSRAENFDDAMKGLEKVLALSPDFIDAHLLKAAILYDLKEYDNSALSFEKALEIDQHYKPRIWYQLGLVRMNQEAFELAASHFEVYLEQEKKSSRYLKRAGKHLANCRFAAMAIRNPVPFKPKSIGDNINTPDFEYLPALSADGELLVYTTRINGQEDIYVSQRKDGEWQAGQPLEGINTPLNEASQSITADGRTVFFVACDRKGGIGGCDLYFSAAGKHAWTPPINLGPQVNSSGWDSQPSISPDGRTLFFSSVRAGGMGGSDLWFAKRRPDGSWSRPENIGAIINTTGDEQSPFIHADGQTLYFMSNGHAGMGGFDLFVSRKDAQGNWGRPQNLGYPINTKANEGALFVSLDGTTAYFDTDQQDIQKGSNTQQKNKADIYYFELHEAARPKVVTYVKGKIKDAQSGKPLQADIEIIDLTSGAYSTSMVSGFDGDFLVTLPVGHDYALNVSKKGYIFYSENFALGKELSEVSSFSLDIALEAIREPSDRSVPTTSKPVVLKNIFFETGSSQIKPASETELQRLLALLIEHMPLRIRINGHTDNVGEPADNLKLSEDRAKAVYDYLIANGIEANRLQYKGFGEEEPIDTNETELGRRNNRRTEFEVMK